MTVPAILLNADAPAMRHLVGGVPLLTRQILELHRLGVTEFYLVGPVALPHAARHRHLSSDVILHLVPCAPRANLPQQLSALPADLEDALILWSQWLIDPRLLQTLLDVRRPQWLPSLATAAPVPVAARVTRWQVRNLTVATDQWMRDIPQLDPATLDTYSPTHRGPVAFRMQFIDTPDDAVAATKMLIITARKTTMDVIASKLDTVFVNRLVFWLSYSRITPNQVTLATGLVGAIVAWLFLSGWLRLGALLTYAAATLDGVDGKLARATLQFSRFGELEHVLDFFMEQSWYLTITIRLVSMNAKSGLWWIGGGLMVCDLLVKILYGVGRLLFAKQLEELGDFDRAFRRFGGRRNIYMAILLIGFCIGFPRQALSLSLSWALITLVVHVSRMLYHCWRRPATV